MSGLGDAARLTVPAHPCRIMSSRECPPDLCEDLPCARFESNDVTRWNFLDDRTALRGKLDRQSKHGQ